MKIEKLNILRPWKNHIGGIYIYDMPAFQEKGLRQNEGEELMSSAYADGYGYEVDKLCYKFVADQIINISQELNRKINILEIGGGYGSFYDSIVNKVDNYFNIEPSDLEDKQKLNKILLKKNYYHLKASAEEIPIIDNSLDVVVSLASLDHIPNVKLALAEIARVLKPEGKLVFTLNNKRSWWKILLSNTKFLKRREDLILKDHYILWGPTETEEVLGNFFRKSILSTTCFIPQIPIIWRLLLDPLEKIGNSTKSLLGSNLTGVYKK